jgi:hypothetical protein
MRQYFLAPLVILMSPPAAKADTVTVIDNHGGMVSQYQQHWTELAGKNVGVRIAGPCKSACTVLLGHIPRNRICATQTAALGFHLGQTSNSTASMWDSYPADIRAWITQHGGLTHNLIWLKAPEIFRYIHKC